MKVHSVIDKTFSHKNLELAWEKVKKNRGSAGIDEGTVAKFEEGKPMTELHLTAGKSIIMVVDDEPEIVTVVRLMLEQKGFNVRCAYSGEELFAGLEEHKPDLILLDIMMPQMDGLEVLTRLRENSDTASIPVIFLTAKVHDEDLLRGYKMGAKYYITKPFTSTQVLEGINLILGGDQDTSVESL